MGWRRRWEWKRRNNSSSSGSSSNGSSTHSSRSDRGHSNGGGLGGVGLVLAVGGSAAAVNNANKDFVFRRKIISSAGEKMIRHVC